MSRTPIDRVLRSWLQSGGSLSRRLATAFGGFEVRVLSQGVAPARPDELAALREAAVGMRVQRCHVREVMLWMKAMSSTCFAMCGSMDEIILPLFPAGLNAHGDFMRLPFLP